MVRYWQSLYPVERKEKLLMILMMLMMLLSLYLIAINHCMGHSSFVVTNGVPLFKL